jgi:hypothetical protein
MRLAFGAQLFPQLGRAMRVELGLERGTWNAERGPRRGDDAVAVRHEQSRHERNAAAAVAVQRTHRIHMRIRVQIKYQTHAHNIRQSHARYTGTPKPVGIEGWRHLHTQNASHPRSPTVPEMGWLGYFSPHLPTTYLFL